MKWFKHDSDASSDAKIKKLIIRYGAVGYAVYFHCLELIAGNVSNDNITFELEHDSEIIADNLRIKGTADKSGVQVVEEVMRYIVQLELFENHDGRITCFKMIKRLDSSMTSNPAFRKLIADAKNSHDLLGKNHDTVMMSHDSVMLEENRIEKKRTEENINTCSELTPKSESVEADKPVYCTIITNTGYEYPITADLVELWKTTFPAVNIEQQLLSMKSWSITHPKNRKTKNGMLAFVNNWLSKEQNKPAIQTRQTTGQPSQSVLGNEDRWEQRRKELEAQRV
jgi:hypothetical protein